MREKLSPVTAGVDGSDRWGNCHQVESRMSVKENDAIAQEVHHSCSWGFFCWFVLLSTHHLFAISPREQWTARQQRGSKQKKNSQSPYSSFFNACNAQCDSSTRSPHDANVDHDRTPLDSICWIDIVHLPRTGCYCKLFHSFVAHAPTRRSSCPPVALSQCSAKRGERDQRDQVDKLLCQERFLI